MGELADDAVDGLMCSGCGVYFEEAHGYPVLCHTCWSAEPMEGVQRAIHEELKF